MGLPGLPGLEMLVKVTGDFSHGGDVTNSSLGEGKMVLVFTIESTQLKRLSITLNLIWKSPVSL